MTAALPFEAFGFRVVYMFMFHWERERPPPLNIKEHLLAGVEYCPVYDCLLGLSRERSAGAR